MHYTSPKHPSSIKINSISLAQIFSAHFQTKYHLNMHTSPHVFCSKVLDTVRLSGLVYSLNYTIRMCINVFVISCRSLEALSTVLWPERHDISKIVLLLSTDFCKVRPMMKNDSSPTLQTSWSFHMRRYGLGCLPRWNSVHLSGNGSWDRDSLGYFP